MRCNCEVFTLQNPATLILKTSLDVFHPKVNISEWILLHHAVNFIVQYLGVLSFAKCSILFVHRGINTSVVLCLLRLL